MTVVRFATANLQGHANPRPGETVRQLEAVADVIGFQEAQGSGALAAVARLRDRGWYCWFGGGLGDGVALDAMAWRRDRFQVLDKGAVKAHEDPPQAHWGPARWILWAALRDRETGAEFAAVNTHMIHQAWSSHPERRYLWNRHADVLAETLRDLWRRYSSVVGGGDVNRSRWRPAGTTGHWADQGTLGPDIFYDVIFTAGPATRTGAVRRIPTLSDHDALVAPLSIPDPVKEEPVTYRRLTDLADVARASGLRVVEIPGWRDNGRPPSTGGFNPRGVLCHHTGAKDVNPRGITDDREYAEWLAEIGRSDLPAPLCQLALDRTSTVYVCAAGRGNHAGRARATGPMPSGDGNELYLGIEAHNTGSEGWDHRGTDAVGNAITQAEGYARLVAALNHGYSWPASHTRGHKETSVTGKWDPGGLDMNRFRDIVADIDLEDELMGKADDILAKLDHFYDVEHLRYQTYTKRFQHLASLIRGVDAGEAPDPQAWADAVPDDIAERVVSLLVKRLEE